MAEGLGVKIPLFVDSIDGAYGLSKDMEELAQQNLKTIILTSPGERVMIPDFGVGVRNYLFEQNTPGTQIALQNAIQQQVAKYAPISQLKTYKFQALMLLEHFQTKETRTL